MVTHTCWLDMRIKCSWNRHLVLCSAGRQKTTSNPTTQGVSEPVPMQNLLD